MATEPPEGDTYMVDPESPAELDRLLTLDSMATKAMGGVFAGLTEDEIKGLHHVLDLACGPGSWVLDVASAYPGIEVVGVDIGRAKIDYANARAQTQHIPNASFRVMNIIKPLDFAAGSFDLINARFLVAVLMSAAWESLLVECRRLLHPGGIIRLTEPVGPGETTSPAFERFSALIVQAHWKAGYGFSVDGRGFGITPVLPSLLRKVGFQHVRYQGHALEISSDTEAGAGFYRNTEVAYLLSKPLLVKLGLVTQEEIDQLYQQMLTEMKRDDFKGIACSLTFWATKAE